MSLVHDSFQWGQDGHKIVARIAANLLGSTNTAVDRPLNGLSLPDVATWPDSYRSFSQVSSRINSRIKLKWINTNIIGILVFYIF